MVVTMVPMMVLMMVAALSVELRMQDDDDE